MSPYTFLIFLFVFSGFLELSFGIEFNEHQDLPNFIFGFTVQLSLCKGIELIPNKTAITVIDDKGFYSDESYSIYFIDRLVTFTETYDFQNIPIIIGVTPLLNKYLSNKFLERIGFKYDYSYEGTHYWYYPNNDHCSKETKHSDIYWDLSTDYTTIRIWDDLIQFKGQVVYAISDDPYFGTNVFGVYGYVTETTTESDSKLYRYYSGLDPVTRNYRRHRMLFIELSSIIIPTGNLRLRLTFQEEMRDFRKRFD